MAQRRATLKLDLTPLRWLAKRYKGQGLPGGLDEQWGKIYERFIRRRFARSGDGTWRPLAPSTIASRRKGKGAGIPQILRDTGVLFRALTIRAPGNLFQKIKQGVRYGFGGVSRHPGGQASIADIGRFHDSGDGVPQRQIIVDLDNATLRLMLRATKRVNERLMRQASRKRGRLRRVR